MSLLTDRIHSRLAALELNPTSAAAKAGLKPDFVRDILRGRVRDPSSFKLAMLAAVLECSTEHLLGLSREVGDPPKDAAAAAKDMLTRRVRLPVRYELRAGHFVKRTDEDPEHYGHIDATPGAAITVSQWAERVADKSANLIVPKGYVVQVADAEEMAYRPKDGDLVIVELTAEGGALFERTLRQVEDWSWASGQERWVYRLPSQSKRWEVHNIDTGEPGVAERARVVALALRAYGDLPLR